MTAAASSDSQPECDCFEWEFALGQVPVHEREELRLVVGLADADVGLEGLRKGDVITHVQHHRCEVLRGLSQTVRGPAGSRRRAGPSGSSTVGDTHQSSRISEKREVDPPCDRVDAAVVGDQAIYLVEGAGRATASCPS